jgi:hypothetical protein
VALFSRKPGAPFGGQAAAAGKIVDASAKARFQAVIQTAGRTGAERLEGAPRPGPPIGDVAARPPFRGGRMMAFTCGGVCMAVAWFANTESLCKNPSFSKISILTHRNHW